MSTWAFRKQFFYGALFILIAGGILALLLIPFFQREPSCSDGRKNGDEVGVDCGGSCLLYCREEVSDPVVLWSRSFEAAPGVFNSVAYIENQNRLASIESVSYLFRLYDESNVLLGERTGTTFIGSKGRMVIFEQGISTGTRIPARTTFEFTSPFEWKQIGESADIVLRVSNTSFTRATGNPRISSTISNPSLFIVPNIEVGVILYGSDGNAFATSRTVIPELAPGGQKQVFFSWPQGLEKEYSRIEILPEYDPYQIRLR